MNGKQNVVSACPMRWTDDVSRG